MFFRIKSVLLLSILGFHLFGFASESPTWRDPQGRHVGSYSSGVGAGQPSPSNSGGGKGMPPTTGTGFPQSHAGNGKRYKSPLTLNDIYPTPVVPPHGSSEPSGFLLPGAGKESLSSSVVSLPQNSGGAPSNSGQGNGKGNSNPGKSPESPHIPNQPNLPNGNHRNPQPDQPDKPKEDERKPNQYSSHRRIFMAPKHGPPPGFLWNKLERWFFSRDSKKPQKKDEPVQEDKTKNENKEASENSQTAAAGSEATNTQIVEVAQEKEKKENKDKEKGSQSPAPSNEQTDNEKKKPNSIPKIYQFNRNWRINADALKILGLRLNKSSIAVSQIRSIQPQKVVITDRMRISSAINTISHDAHQIFSKYNNDVYIKAYHDATQRMCDAANALNNQGKSGQAQAAANLAHATKEAGKVKINAGNQSAAFVSAMEGKAEQEGNALVGKALAQISQLGDSVSESLHSAWKDFKAQPNKEKAIVLAGGIATGLGVAYGAGVTPAIVVAYGHVIANELSALGDKIGSLIPFSSAPLISGFQKFFESTPKCSHTLFARSAQHSVNGQNLAARIWNGTSPLYHRAMQPFDFSVKAAERWNLAHRRIPIQTIIDIIKSPMHVLPDPKGSSAQMYYSRVFKDNKLYNVEVLYDQTKNAVWHFKYTDELLGPLKALD